MNRRILVVDDEPDVLRLLRVVLERDGYAVVEADSGLGIESLVEEFSPDLVLLDVMLPGRSGFEVCQSLKTKDTSRHIPILMLTALRGHAEESRAFKAGADDFMSKPIDRGQLLSRVRSHMRVKQLYDEVETARLDVERLTRELAERTAERNSALELVAARDLPADGTERLANWKLTPDGMPSAVSLAGQGERIASELPFPEQLAAVQEEA